jgi:predicted dehydrogenase
VVGCGLIGKRRAAQIAIDPDARLALAVDVEARNTEALQLLYGCRTSSDWNDALSPEIDAVVVSTPNHLSAPIAIAALRAGKDVLIEKPLGRNAAESEAIVSAARESPRFLVVKTGFNHRFHPALSKAKALIDAGTIGPLLSIRGRYGHGGRPGMEKEWRASKELCGGGELLDQGIHLIDLIQWFGSELTEVYGMVETKFWNMSVEDNAYVVGKTARGINAIFHVSWTNWKNIFSFELFGSDGYISINGLGGSYGSETLELGIRKPEGGRPDLTTFEFPAEDISWELEWKEFKAAMIERRSPLGSGEDGLKANLVIEAILRSHKSKTAENTHEPRPKGRGMLWEGFRTPPKFGSE